MRVKSASGIKKVWRPYSCRDCCVFITTSWTQPFSEKQARVPCAIYREITADEGQMTPRILGLQTRPFSIPTRLSRVSRFSSDRNHLSARSLQTNTQHPANSPPSHESAAGLFTFSSSIPANSFEFNPFIRRISSFERHDDKQKVVQSRE